MYLHIQMNKVEIKTKIRRVANGYVISIPKALIDTKLFREGEKIVAKIDLKLEDKDENAVIRTFSRNLSCLDSSIINPFAEHNIISC